MNKQKGFLSLLTMLIIIGAVAIATGGGMLAWQNWKPAQNNLTPVACVPNWQCGWGPCVNGSQVQVEIDSNNCGTQPFDKKNPCPVLARVCTSQCIAENGTGERSSIKPNNCCAGLQEQDTAMTNSVPGFIIYKCIKNNSTQTSITSISPLSASVGETVTVYGNNFAFTNTGVGTRVLLNSQVIDLKSVKNTSLTFVVPSGLQPGVYNLSVKGSAGTSNILPFTIVAPTTTPTITVTSPIAGAIYHVGDTVNISWTTAGIIGNVGLFVSPANPVVGSTAVTININAPNTGNYSWQTSSFPTGNYKIEVTSYYNGTSTWGDSGQFTIVAPTAGSCTDSDGGINYNVKGNLTVTNINGHIVNEDDFCLSSKVLSEAYCNASIASHSEYTCPNVCSSGACK